jgi:hypothetical protein
MYQPVTVAEWSKAWTVFARSDAGIVGETLTEFMDVWCVYVFILCLCCPVFKWRPCDKMNTRRRSTDQVTERTGQGPQGLYSH